MGPTLCRLYPFFFYGNVGASLMSMVAITINRYEDIEPFKYQRKNRNTVIVVFALLSNSKFPLKNLYIQYTVESECTVGWSSFTTCFRF